MNQLMNYLLYAVILYLVFEHCQVFELVQKQVKGQNPMVVKFVMVSVGVYLLNYILLRQVIEGFNPMNEVRNVINTIGNINPDEVMNQITGLFEDDDPSNTR